MQVDMDKVFTLLLMAFFTVIPGLGSGQTVPWENQAPADSLYEAKQYKAALELYKPLLVFYEEKRTLLKGARCAAQTGDNKLALKYLDRLVNLGWNSSRSLRNDKELSPIYAEAKFNALLKKVEKLEARSAGLKSETVLAELDSLSAYDKKYRKRPDMKAEQARLDSLNGVRLERLIGQYGWLGSNLLGGRNYCWLALLRQPLAFQKKYFGIMRKSVKKGEEERAFLAFLEDQMLVAQGKKQKYGTQIDAEKKEVYPIQEPEKVDLYRASAGLGSHKGFLKIWNIE